MIQLYEKDNGERWSRNQVKMMMMFVLGAVELPEPQSRALISNVFKKLDGPYNPEREQMLKLLNGFDNTEPRKPG